VREFDTSVLRFGVFEADTRTGELRRQGARIKIQDQPFQVLVMLLERPGEVVTREELRDRIWPGVFVDYDKSLSKAVGKVREVLGDSPENSRFIETLPRRGYRFLVPVEPVQAATEPARPTPTHVAEAGGRRGWVLWALAAMLAGSTAVGVGVWVWGAKLLPGSGQSALVAVPLTTYPGRQSFPAFSPDGNQIAFAWNGPKQDNTDIYVKVNGTENLLRLTKDPAPDYAPAWSPDGRYIAFLREFAGGRIAVMTIPSLGGPPERKLTEISAITESPRQGEAPPALSWSPDGKWIAMKDRAQGEARQSLYLFSLDTGEKRRLIVPPPNCADGSPAFSPDGRSLAFSRAFTFGVSEVYLVDLSEDLVPKAPPKQLTSGRQLLIGLAWTPDGREIVYSSGPDMGGPVELRRVTRSGSGEPRVLAVAGEHGRWPAISRNGNRLAFTRNYASDLNIWRLDLSARHNEASDAVKLIGSTRNDLVPQYSPDGKRIVFISQRSGCDEVWVCNNDGSDAVQLTSLRASITGTPRWSPDGERIAFDSNARGNFDVYVVGAAGGRPKRLTDHPADDGIASWSRDGHFIYFVSNRAKSWNIWRMPAEGGDAVQMTSNGGYFVFESPDGASLYYAKHPTASTLWKKPVQGGKETQVLDSLYGASFAVRDNGIHFLRPPDGGGSPTLRFLSFETGAIKTIASIPRLINHGLTVSPDGRYALYTQEDAAPGSELMIVENFR
jgi:Tol biopolymer transport system component/DNA-binding winged helix-turn-helix (wHTH) protein